MDIPIQTHEIHTIITLINVMEQYTIPKYSQHKDCMHFAKKWNSWNIYISSFDDALSLISE